MKEIKLITKKEIPDFQNIFNAYIQELSVFDESLKDEKKLKYLSNELNTYFDNEKKIAIQLLIDNSVAGFAFIKALDNGVCEITEFYITPEFRMNDNGLNFAFDIISALDTVVTFSTNLKNEKAKAFWNKLSEKFKEVETYENNGFVYWTIKKEKEPDNRSFSEKLEDGVEGFFDGLQNIMYGERKSLDEDIPATIELPSGRRKVLKYQTRRNINRKLFHNKTTVKIVFIILGIILGSFFVSRILMMLLTK